MLDILAPSVAMNRPRSSPDGREERDTLALRVNVVGQLRGRVVAEHEPKHNVSDERKVGCAEVVHLGGPRGVVG